MSIFLDWTWGNIDAGDVGPGMFSWFHILSLVLMVILLICMALTDMFSNPEEKEGLLL